MAAWRWRRVSWIRAAEDDGRQHVRGSPTCPVMIGENNTLTGAVIAFRSQDNPSEVYIQDVMIHPDHRQQGIARALLNSVHTQAEKWGCERIYLTSEPENQAAHATWIALR